ncbi:hypothetical protein AB0K09_31810 [Streptomyces sp. NPDC049577]|uniref:hypothetical protein n=1 Tax=Streptomyces sp. NPDC049577 TaxID=3155153 RepID=UPI0034424F81
MMTKRTGEPTPRRPRCDECWDIKRRRAQALERGDLQRAVSLTGEMGAHLRVAHP